MDPSREEQLGDALRGVLDAQRESSKQLATARANQKRRDGHTKYQPGLLLFIVAAWAFIGYAWLAKPAFLFEGPHAATLTATQREAKLRFAIFLQHGRIEAFRHDQGRLPKSLREAGAAEDGVEFERTADDGYEVFGSADGTVLRLSSRMSADSFLGNARSRLPTGDQ